MPLFGTPDGTPSQPPGFDPNDFNYSPIGKIGVKYQWNTWGDNCVICNAMRGQVHTLDFWMNSGIWPGFHPNCDCTMQQVEEWVPVSDPDIFGTAIPLFSRMVLPWPNIIWDPEFFIQPWQMSVVDSIEKLHVMYGADTPFRVLFEKLKGSGIFSHRTTFYGDTAGWRVLATRRHFENIDGGLSGSDIFTLRHIKSILEPLWIWFQKKWKTESVYDPNKKYAQMRREDTPVFLKPFPLRPMDPRQTNYTEQLR